MRALRGLMGRFLLPVAVGGGLLALVAQPAHANGVPQLVKLTYLEDLSSWGPKDAEGVLEFSFAEGFLSLEAVGLPRLVGQAYEGWLVRSATNEAISVGQFNAGSDNQASYDVRLPRISDYSLDLFIVTVESLSDPSEGPSEQRSIGGFFSVLDPVAEESQHSETGELSDQDRSATAPDAEGSDAGTQSSAAGDPSGDAGAQSGADAPTRLPETGDAESFISSVRGLALIVAGGVALLWATVRTRKRLRKGG